MPMIAIIASMWQDATRNKIPNNQNRYNLLGFMDMFVDFMIKSNHKLLKSKCSTNFSLFAHGTFSTRSLLCEETCPFGGN